MRRIVASVVTVVAATVIGLSSARVATATTDDEAEWILTSQLPDGAIAQYSDFTRINPYLGNYAAMGLVRAWAQTGNTAYVDAAERWFAWYQSHMDVDGYVTDYDLGPGPDYVETSTGSEDSTDAYAGTLLLVLYQLQRQGAAGRLRLQAYGALATKAAAAVISTQQSDGLTWAKPSYEVKFLMDQAEAFAGLKAASKIARVFHDKALAATTGAAAKALRDGLDTMWDPATGFYRRAKLSDGTLDTTTWSYYYPDAASEAWVVAVGNFLSPKRLIRASRARTLLATFTTTWPEWTQPDATVAFRDPPGTGRVDYWPLIGGALSAVHRKVEGLAGAQAIETYAAGSARAYPFVVASAGQLLLLR
jgi:hypothetical protein